MKPGIRWIFVFLSFICMFITDAHAQTATMDREPIPEGKRPDERPDLIAAELTHAPDVPAPGSQVHIRMEVRNRGREPVEDAKILLMVNGQALPEKWITVPAEGMATLSWRWTADRSGEYMLHAVADPDFQIFERDRSDNSISKELMVAEAPPLSSFEILQVETVREPDRPQRVRIVLRNNGKIAAQAPVSVLIDSKVAASRLFPVLGPGEEGAVEIPVGRLENVRDLKARVQVGQRSIEHSLVDGVRALETAAKPDLRPAKLSIHAAQPEPGQPRLVTVSFRIENRGSSPVSVPFQTRIAPGIVDPAGRRPAYIETGSLDVGAVTYVSHTIANAPSVFDITVNVDADNAVSEDNEENNRLESHFKNPVPGVNRWVSIGPSRITGSKAHGYAWDDAVGRLATIAIHPTSPNTMYVGGQGSGIWKTTTGGLWWFPLTDHIDVSVAALALDPTNPSKVFWATARRGFYISTDAGSSWIQVSAQDLEAITHGGILLVNPNTPDTLFLNSAKGVYRSIDGGTNWMLSLGGGSVSGLVMSASDPDTLYATIYHKTNNEVAGIYVTRNSGDDWRKITGCPGGLLPKDTAGTKITLARSGNRYFAGFRSKNAFRLFKTSSVGCSIGGRKEQLWEKGWETTKDPRVFWSGMWADPTDSDYLYLGGTYFWRSTDGGKTFELTSGQGSPPDGAHVDHHGFAVRPMSPNVIYTLNDGGIYRSNDRGKKSTWNFLGNGIYNVEFYDIGLSCSAPEFVTGGTQDNGTMRYDGPSTVWRMIRGGDGATVAIDPKDSQIHYSLTQYADSIARWNQGNNRWEGMAQDLPKGAICFNLQYILHPGKPATLIAPCSHNCEAGVCSGGLWRITSPTGTWSVILSDANATIVRAAVDAKADIYYAGTNRGRLYAGINGTGWQTVFTHPSGVGFSDIEVDLDNPSVVYGSFGGSGTGRVYRLMRTTVPPSMMQAEDITSDLPAGLRVKCLAVDRMTPLTVYAGTGRGVYRGRSSDGGKTWFWTTYNNGLPLADVREMEVHPVTGAMRAATYGRGAFEVNTDFPIGSVLSATGKLTLLRVHDVGTKYGPPSDQIDVEVVVQLDTKHSKAFGFKLRKGPESVVHRRMLDELRSAFRQNDTVRLEYTRRGLRNGEILRVMRKP